MRTRIAALLVAGAALAGCGGSGSAGQVEELIAHLPFSSAAVVVVEPESPAWEALSQRVVRPATGVSLDAVLDQVVGRATGVPGLRRVLDGPIVVGTPLSAAEAAGGGTLPRVLSARGSSAERLEAALRAAGARPGPEALGARVWRGLPGAAVATDGAVLVAAPDRELLDDALAQRDGGGRLTPERFGDTLDGALGKRSPLFAGAPVRAYGDVRALLRDERLRSFASLSFVRALRTGGAAATVDGDSLVAAAGVSLKPAAVRPSDLPVPPRAATPPLPRRPAPLLGAARDPGRTAAFALRLLRAGRPDAGIVRAAAVLREETGVDLVEDLLPLLGGPSASILDPLTGAFAARVQTRDAHRVQAVTDRIAPSIGPLAAELAELPQALRTLLLLVAPVAPTGPEVASAGRPTVAPVDERPGLWQLTGTADPDPPTLVFGVLGESFVVASDVRRAAGIERVRPLPPPLVAGATVVRADPRAPGGTARERFGAALERSLGQIDMALHAERSFVTVRLRAPLAASG